MKSIYLRNFIATAAMIGLGLLLVAVSIFLIGRSYIIEDYRANMISSAQEVAHTASAVAEKDSLNSWLLRMILSSISKATGNHIMITDSDGMVVSCCDELPICSHMGRVLPEDIVTAVNTTGGYQGRLLVSGFFGEERILVAEPIPGESEDTIGFVVVSIQQRNIFSSPANSAVTCPSL